jgi:hypothetical protein
MLPLKLFKNSDPNVCDLQNDGASLSAKCSMSAAPTILNKPRVGGFALKHTESPLARANP